MFSYSDNPLIHTDAYKTGHHKMYPKGTTKIVTNLTARSSRLDTKDVVFFGLQGYIKNYLMNKWLKLFTDEGDKLIAECEDVCRNLLNDPNYSADHFRKLQKLGYLPIKIRAIPEGTRVPLRIPLLTVENTHPDFAWLPNYLETQISAEIWHSIVSATIANLYRRNFNNYATLTGADREFCNWQGHDFSMRGQTSVISATKSGAAHLCSFLGTDTLPAIRYIQQYYQGTHFVGGSVPATEHSVMSAGGSNTNEELDTYRYLLNEYPEGIISIVSDTWDYWKVITEYLPILKNTIINRNGKVVIRPDSGDPVKILIGDPKAEQESIRKGTIECLWDIFGGTRTSLGYRLLDSHIGVIYGDSITLDRQVAILEGLKAKNFASSNVVLGIGSYTYQCVTRDTLGLAIKATYAEINNNPRCLFKSPKTDDGTKKSAMGLLKVFKDENFHICMKENVTYKEFEDDTNMLKLVYSDGNLIRDYSISDIRHRLANE